MEYDRIATGNRALEARLNKKLKQEEIASDLGIHQATYSKFELGRYDMPISKLIKLCKILDVSLNWLTGVNSIPELTDSERLDVEKYIQFIISNRNHKR